MKVCMHLKTTRRLVLVQGDKANATYGRAPVAEKDAGATHSTVSHLVVQT